MTARRFTDEVTVIVSPCASCFHKSLDRASCTAFPAGIPGEILSGEHQHRSPFPGDHGIQYEPLPGAEHLREE